MRRAIINIIKILVSLAALLNLAALFVFDYQIPAQWHLSERLHMPFLARFETVQTEFIIQESESELQQSGIRIEVPAGSIIYNGTGELDLMNNVYVVNADGTSAGDIPVKTEISAGNGRREKVVTYTAVTPDGEVLTATRSLSLGNRYTGPSIKIQGNMPWCPEGGADDYAQTLIDSGAVIAEDGFENDITSDIETSLKRYDASLEEATITITVTNRYQDSYSTEVQVPMNATGIVLILTGERAEVEYGSTFSSLPYVQECYDIEGNDLRDNVVREGDVDTYTPGDYEITVYTTDSEGTRSIVRHMTITVLEPPEEEGTQE